MIARRGLLAGLGALLAAPAIIRTPGLLMPVKPIVVAQPVLDAGKIAAIAAAVREGNDALVRLMGSADGVNWAPASAVMPADGRFILPTGEHRYLKVVVQGGGGGVWMG